MGDVGDAAVVVVVVVVGERGWEREAMDAKSASIGSGYVERRVLGWVCDAAGVSVQSRERVV